MQLNTQSLDPLFHPILFDTLLTPPIEVMTPQANRLIDLVRTGQVIQRPSLGPVMTRPPTQGGFNAS
jgi:hypothetical protein